MTLQFSCYAVLVSAGQMLTSLMCLHSAGEYDKGGLGMATVDSSVLHRLASPGTWSRGTWEGSQGASRSHRASGGLRMKLAQHRFCYILSIKDKVQGSDPRDGDTASGWSELLSHITRERRYRQEKPWGPLLQTIYHMENLGSGPSVFHAKALPFEQIWAKSSELTQSEGPRKSSVSTGSLVLMWG